MFTGRPDLAIGYTRTAVALETDPRYQPLEFGWSIGLEAAAHSFAGRIDRCLEIYAAMAEQTGAAHIGGLCGLMEGLPLVGRAEEARAIASETLAAARAHANPIFIVRALNGYGRLLTQTDPVRALDVYRQALACAREHRLAFWEPLIGQQAAGLEAVHGNLDQGLTLFDTTIDSWHQAGDFASLTATLAYLAVFFDRFERPEVAAFLFGSTNHTTAFMPTELPAVAEHLRAVLGATRFDECVATGAAMELADAVRYAHHHIDNIRQHRP